MSDRELLTCLGIAAFIVVCFVLAFFKTGPQRFIAGALLLLGATMLIFDWREQLNREDSAAKQASEHQRHLNRMAQIRGEEIPTGGAKEPLPFATPTPRPYIEGSGLTTRIGGDTFIAKPLATPRSTPSAAEVQAELLRKYGAK